MSTSFRTGEHPLDKEDRAQQDARIVQAGRNAALEAVRQREQEEESRDGGGRDLVLPSEKLRSYSSQQQQHSARESSQQPIGDHHPQHSTPQHQQHATHSSNVQYPSYVAGLMTLNTDTMAAMPIRVQNESDKATLLLCKHQESLFEGMKSDRSTGVFGGVAVTGTFIKDCEEQRQLVEDNMINSNVHHRMTEVERKFQKQRGQAGEISAFSTALCARIVSQAHVSKTLDLEYLAKAQQNELSILKEQLAISRSSAASFEQKRKTKRRYLEEKISAAEHAKKTLLAELHRPRDVIQADQFSNQTTSTQQQPSGRGGENPLLLTGKALLNRIAEAQDDRQRVNTMRTAQSQVVSQMQQHHSERKTLKEALIYAEDKVSGSHTGARLHIVSEAVNSMKEIKEEEQLLVDPKMYLQGLAGNTATVHVADVADEYLMDSAQESHFNRIQRVRTQARNSQDAKILTPPHPAPMEEAGFYEERLAYLNRAEQVADRFHDYSLTTSRVGVDRDEDNLVSRNVVSRDERKPVSSLLQAAKQNDPHPPAFASVSQPNDASATVTSEMDREKSLTEFQRQDTVEFEEESHQRMRDAQGGGIMDDHKNNSSMSSSAAVGPPSWYPGDHLPTYMELLQSKPRLAEMLEEAKLREQEKKHNQQQQQEEQRAAAKENQHSPSSPGSSSYTDCGCHKKTKRDIARLRLETAESIVALKGIRRGQQPQRR